MAPLSQYSMYVASKGIRIFAVGGINITTPRSHIPVNNIRTTFLVHDLYFATLRAIYSSPHLLLDWMCTSYKPFVTECTKLHIDGSL